MLFLVIGNPLHAQSPRSFICDQISVEMFPRTAHFKGFAGKFDLVSNGFVATCGFAFPVFRNLSIVTGYSVMSFVNSFGVQSYSFGAAIEAQYRPEALESVGLYLGIDGGFIYGYEGFFAEDRMFGPLTPAGSFKGGVLYDIPDSRVTVFGGLRVVPPVQGHTGIISPTIGLTYRF